MTSGTERVDPLIAIACATCCPVNRPAPNWSRYQRCGISSVAPDSACNSAAACCMGACTKPQNGFTAIRRSSGHDGATRSQARVIACSTSGVTGTAVTVPFDVDMRAGARGSVGVVMQSLY